MKIGIVCSGMPDLYLLNLLKAYDHEYEIFLDNRFGPWGGLSREDSLERLQLCLENEVLKGCDKLILPPIYELAQKHRNIEAQKHGGVLSLFETYIKQYVLPYSVVGKIGCIGYGNHMERVDEFWNQIISNHVPTTRQLKNKHFQNDFPLYKLKTDHWSALYDLPRARFVNKLIKTDLKKMKDYAIDSLLPMEYGYFKHQKTFLDTFHKKVRFHRQEKLGLVLDGMIKDNQNQCGITIYSTGDLTQIESNKKLMWLLGSGKNVKIKFEKFIF